MNYLELLKELNHDEKLNLSKTDFDERIIGIEIENKDFKIYFEQMELSFDSFSTYPSIHIISKLNLKELFMSHRFIKLYSIILPFLDDMIIFNGKELW